MTGLDVVEHYNSLTRVFQIPWIEATNRYESALVYDLPRVLSAKIEELRCRISVNAPPKFQLKPHLTILFLGHMSGAQLIDLWQNLHEYRCVTTEVMLQCLGTFQTSNRITNVHIQVSPDLEILALHEQVLNLCSGFPWFSPGPYVGCGYVPHISILDQIDVPVSGLDLPEPNWTLGERLRLDNLHLIAKQLEVDNLPALDC